MPSSQMLQLASLHEDNLIPVYLIEDRLKDNFRNTNNFIRAAKDEFGSIHFHLTALNTDQQAMKASFESKMKEMQAKIMQQISLQLQGRIAVVVSKSIESFTEKLDKKEGQISSFKQQFEKQIESMKQGLKYEISQDNQKLIIKENKKMEQNLKSLQKKIEAGVPIAAKAQQMIPKSVENATDYEAASQQQSNWQEQHLEIKQLERRIEKMEEFSVNVDKRFYNSITSLKDSWKQLGQELLENKKAMVRKFDELRVDFIKLKNLKEFSIAPEKIEDEFKRKLAEKFTDIYQLLSVTLTKNEYESSSSKTSKRISRHDDEFIEIRKELAANNQFFTFYSNNADQDDLRQNISELKEKLNLSNSQFAVKVRDLKSYIESSNQQIYGMLAQINRMKEDFQEKSKTISKVNEIVSLVESRIQNLEDFNKFGPDKLERIHNVLDNDFTATERELINTKQKKNSIAHFQQAQREIKIEVAKMKDEMFVMSSQNRIKEEEVSEMKKFCLQIEARLERVKGQTEEAMVSRKPWVCLSCDKQDKQKQQKKQSKIKKPEPFKGFGPQRNSERNLKMLAPPFEERFEVYEKFKEKYLSDTVKLPDIYKEKLKDSKDVSYHL